MCMLTRRVQILLDEDRYERLATEARSRKVSVAEVVREAIDRTLPLRWPARGAAGLAILDAPSMPVPETVEDLKAEIDASRKPAP
jgi:Ribbon-helix-helix protein, copG family